MRSVLTGPALGLIILSGCQQLEPRWLIDRLPGTYPEVTYYFPTEQRIVALTLDDGPDPQATPALLQVLKDNSAKATFFLLSDAMLKYPELVSQIQAAGHEIGNHMTADEPSAKLSPEAFVEKLDHAGAVIDRFAGSAEEVRWFRPGHGWYNAQMKAELQARGYRIALASMIPLDARLRAPGFVAGYIKRTVEPGSVIVLHSVGERGLRAVRTLESVLPALQDRGYRVDTLSAVAATATQIGPRPGETP